jgi:hypothetical protein
MKSKIQKDVWRREYIRLLTVRGEPWTNLTPEHIEELHRTDELIQAGYMSGEVFRDSNGEPMASRIEGPTVAGRIFAEEQQEILDKKSLWGRVKACAVLFVGWLAGIASAIIASYFSK